MTAPLRLHLKAAIVARFPLFQEGPVIEAETRRLLGEADIERSSGERGGDNHGKLSSKHGSLHITSLAMTVRKAIASIF